MKTTILILVFLFSSFLSSIVVAQESNSDSLFLAVKKHVELKKYDLAINQINTLISSYPENFDYSFYLANVYYWSGENDLAQSQVLRMIERNPNNESLFNLLVRIELAAKKSSDLLKHSELGIQLFPEKNEFYKLHKAHSLVQLEKDEEALLILNDFKKSSEFYDAAQYIKTQNLQKQKNMISIGYLNTTFSNPGFAPWHFGTVEYLRKKKKNAFVGRLNYGALFGTQGLQAEVDAYPKTGKSSYLYLNVGVSDGKSIFPLFRFGTEFYKSFKSYTTSVGGRLLYFKSSQVLMFTGHIGKNFKTYHFAYRPFIVGVDGGWFTSHILNLRKTFDQKESFIQLDLQYGAVPYYFFVFDQFLRTSSYRVGVNSRFRVKDNFFIQPILMYEFEEYIPSDFRNRFNFQLILSKRF